MESWFRLILVFATSLLYVAPVPHFLWRPQDSESVRKAVAFYNEEQRAGFLFRPLPGGAQDKQTDPQSGDKVTFRIKETVCQKSSSRDLAECEFKKDGEIKDCSANIDRYLHDVINVKCKIFSETSNHLHNKLAKYKEKLKTKNQNGKLVKRRSLDPLKAKKLSNESSKDSIAHAAASCIPCLFDLLGTQSG